MNLRCMAQCARGTCSLLQVLSDQINQTLLQLCAPCMFVVLIRINKDYGNKLCSFLLLSSSICSLFFFDASSSPLLFLRCMNATWSAKPPLPAARSRQEQKHLHAAPVTSAWYSSNNVYVETNERISSPNLSCPQINHHCIAGRTNPLTWTTRRHQAGGDINLEMPMTYRVKRGRYQAMRISEVSNEWMKLIEIDRPTSKAWLKHSK